jgi:hypothetical protein
MKNLAGRWWFWLLVVVALMVRAIVSRLAVRQRNSAVLGIGMTGRDEDAVSVQLGRQVF